jgi:anti-anti-sigma factor
VGRLQGTIDQTTDRAVVRVGGEIDLANAPDFAELLEPLRSSGSPVTIDLTEVTFIDSCGIHALLDFAAHSANGQGPLTIANPSRTALRVMEIVGMTDVAGILVEVGDGQQG